MRINEILVESQNLEEGPLLNKLGTGIGKAVGTVAKGVGAVAGGVAGLGRAAKKGYMAGLQTVGGAGDEEDPAAPAQKPTLSGAFKAGAAAVRGTPASNPAAAPATQAAAPTAAPRAQQTAAPTASAQPAAAPSQSAYAQIKSNIDKLDKKGKQRILATLNKELGIAPSAPAAAPAAGAGAFGQMANQLGTAAPSSSGGQVTATPTGVKHTAAATNPNQPAPAAAPAPTAVKKPLAKPKAKPVSTLAPR